MCRLPIAACVHVAILMGTLPFVAIVVSGVLSSLHCVHVQPRVVLTFYAVAGVADILEILYVVWIVA